MTRARGVPLSALDDNEQAVGSALASDRDWVERGAAGLMILGIGCSPRIALANILLGVASLLWIAALIRGSATWRRAPIVYHEETEL